MYLGLDLGTSGLRAILADEDGSVVNSVERGYPVAHPHPGWSEQDPADWIEAATACIGEIADKSRGAFSRLAAIGLSGQMHGATLLDCSGMVLRPCILWNDTRSADEAAELDGLTAFREVTGNIVFPGFTAPKTLWVARNEPKNFERTAKVVLPKDFLRLWLTGEYVSDMSDSAGTSWLDTGRREWSPPLLEAGGMTLAQMPALVEGSEVSGMLRDGLARKWGIDTPVQVVGGGGDNAAAACGVGCLHEGDGFVSLGTSGVLLAAKNTYRPAPASAVHSFCHALPRRWYQMGVILAATDCLNWLARLTGGSARELAGRLPDTIGGPTTVRFLPYLSGERTPHNDSSARGAFVGLGVATGPDELTQAVMEGVCFALRDCLEALKATGTELSRILAIGGGAASPFWVETLATVLGLEIDLPERGEFGAAMGAARLAAAGARGADPTERMTPPPVAGTVKPRRDLAELYESAYEQYRALYPAIRNTS
jgi:xylulokinase